jgi:hypothetical protein
MNDQARASILRGRDKGVGAVKTILDQTIPGYAPDTRLKFANQIVDALLDKSVSAQLSRRRTVRKINCSRNPRSSMQSCGCHAEPSATGACRLRLHSRRTAMMERAWLPNATGQALTNPAHQRT